MDNPARHNLDDVTLRAENGEIVIETSSGEVLSRIEGVLSSEKINIGPEGSPTVDFEIQDGTLIIRTPNNEIDVDGAKIQNIDRQDQVQVPDIPSLYEEYPPEQQDSTFEAYVVVEDDYVKPLQE